jgi:N-acyl-phosphatidylethanolamine-hydrolysing phospholipase D
MTGALICCIFQSVRLSRRSANFAVPLTWDSIPIGGYDPRHIMSAVHENPCDSVEIFKDTKRKKAMGIH